MEKSIKVIKISRNKILIIKKKPIYSIKINKKKLSKPLFFNSNYINFY